MGNEKLNENGEQPILFKLLGPPRYARVLCQSCVPKVQPKVGAFVDSPYPYGVPCVSAPRTAYAEKGGEQDLQACI